MPRQKRSRDSEQPEFLREARTKEGREEFQRQAAKSIEESAVSYFLLHSIDVFEQSRGLTPKSAAN